MRKKGQDTGINASYLVGMIALLFIVYLIILPSSEKQKLLQNPSSVGEGPLLGDGYPGDNYAYGFASLLSESPGVISPLLQHILTKPLASINLFSMQQRKEEGLASSFYVSNGPFSDTIQKATLKIADLSHLDRALLLFYVLQGEDDLVILLNGQQIFSGVPSADSLPLELPHNLLKPLNTLEFHVASASFLSTNTYKLKEIVALLDYSVENQIEARPFILNSAEYQGLQGATLYYVVNCFTVHEQGRLLIRLNGKVISDNLIVCDAGQVALDLAGADMVPGRNVLEFAVDQGRYILEQVHVDLFNGPQGAPGYFFTLQVPQYQAAQSGVPIWLKLQFLQDNTRKVGTIFINGFPVYLDTFADQFVYNISPFVAPGQNTVRIVPTSQLAVVSLDVTQG